MRRPTSSTRSGFTLLELLTVIAVVGVLVALVLPAVLASVERSRQGECQNRLRQMSMGLLMKSQTDGVYPVGCLGCKYAPPTPGSTVKPMRMLSWNVFLLPYLEERELFESFNLDWPSHHAINKTAAGRTLGTYLCPSTREKPQRNLVGLWKGEAFTDYGGIYGVEGPGRSSISTSATHYLRDEFLGVMLYEVAVNPREIEDGSSHTICLAEMLERRVTETEWANGQNVFAQEGSTPINQRSGLGNEIGSPHRGGAFASFADGHVEFLSDKMDQNVLNAQLTKAGRELVSDF
jgi:prepilin-type N-terminal cleavage/methylation domain-containing protein/prepilin-type processing-associated H-X9-DG protein